MALQMMAGRKNKSAADSDDDEDFNVVGAEEEEHLDDDVDDEKRRSITYEISKNKGLMPKRSKLQRNPRVKHRVKYQKAKVRRKGQVREVRTEVKKYAGEMSGINKRVKKGIKLA
jgi:U3 small nucleolar RNA-associated protein 3